MLARILLGALLVSMLGACAYDGSYYDRGYYTAATYDDDYYDRRYYRDYDRRTVRYTTATPGRTIVRTHTIDPVGDERVLASCLDCGVVTRVERYHGERRASGAGAVTGAIVGGVLGSQIGSGSGRDAATVAGAVAGGVAGHNIEKNRRGSFYEVHVRMDDGRMVIVDQRSLNGVREGARVVVAGGAARLY